MKHYIINDTILPKGSPAREVHRDVSLIDKLVKTEHDFHFPGSPQITLPIPSDVEGSKMELTHVLIDGIQPLYHFTEHVFFNPSKPGQVPSIRARSIWSVFKFESMRYKQGNVILADPTPVSNGFERMLKNYERELKNLAPLYDSNVGIVRMEFLPSSNVTLTVPTYLVSSGSDNDTPGFLAHSRMSLYNRMGFNVVPGQMLESMPFPRIKIRVSSNVGNELIIDAYGNSTVSFEETHAGGSLELFKPPETGCWMVLKTFRQTPSTTTDISLGEGKTLPSSRRTHSLIGLHGKFTREQSVSDMTLNNTNSHIVIWTLKNTFLEIPTAGKVMISLNRLIQEMTPDSEDDFLRRWRIGNVDEKRSQLLPPMEYDSRPKNQSDKDNKELELFRSNFLNSNNRNVSNFLGGAYNRKSHIRVCSGTDLVTQSFIKPKVIAPGDSYTNYEVSWNYSGDGTTWVFPHGIRNEVGGGPDLDSTSSILLPSELINKSITLRDIVKMVDGGSPRVLHFFNCQVSEDSKLTRLSDTPKNFYNLAFHVSINSQFGYVVPMPVRPKEIDSFTNFLRSYIYEDKRCLRSNAVGLVVKSCKEKLLRRDIDSQYYKTITISPSLHIVNVDRDKEGC